jgi:beta-galactosidase/beta-glucuronidase
MPDIAPQAKRNPTRQRVLFLFLTFFLLSECPLVGQPLIQQGGVTVIPPPPNTSPRVNLLKTPWSKDISPAKVHTEYPRPTLVRKEWLNLNGLWDWRDAGRSVPPDAAGTVNDQGKILVPFPIESTLSGVGRFCERIIYRRFFTIPETWSKNNRIILHFGAADWETTAFVNGRPVGTHRGGYDSFSFDITDYLKDSRAGQNELTVQVFDPADQDRQPIGKQSMNPSGTRYSSVSGIWQTVWLEPVPTDYLCSIQCYSDLDTGFITIIPKVNKPRKDLTVMAEAFDGDKAVAKVFGGSEGSLLMRFDKATLKTWSPDSPFLYQIQVRLMDKDVQVDQAGSYCTFRKVDTVKDKQGFSRIRLNNQILFQMGVIDQGYWPDGLYTPPSDEAMRMDIRVAKSLGFNVIRKYLKVEPERWYYWCDRIGILVWQDMPNGENRTADAQLQFREELQRMIQRLSFHPSIILWTIFNEGAGQHHTPEYTEMASQLDPSRLVNGAGGWIDVGVGDLCDSHKFPGPEMSKHNPNPNRVSVIGSFGGFTLVPPEDNLWTPDTWGFQHVPDSDTLLKRYQLQHDELRRLIREQGLSGAVFHQLVDVESECNGLTSYDRVILKVLPEDFNKTNRTTIRIGSKINE